MKKNRFLELTLVLAITLGVSAALYAMPNEQAKNMCEVGGGSFSTTATGWCCNTLEAVTCCTSDGNTCYTDCYSDACCKAFKGYNNVHGCEHISKSSSTITPKAILKFNFLKEFYNTSGPTQKDIQSTKPIAK